MRDSGALGTAMTGSGSAVFGIFDAFDMAAMASMQLMEKYTLKHLALNLHGKEAMVISRNSHKNLL
jgi:4-diphosphocytidyl-2C-methyl-D-erythritol kinase